MRGRWWWVAGCVLGFASVAGGAFGAHGLRQLVPPERLVTWGTGADYAMAHALALLAVGLAQERVGGRALDVAGVGFFSGTLLFTGSLWALVLLDIPQLGAITPLGGLLYLMGWAAAGVAAWRAGGPPS